MNELANEWVSSCQMHVKMSSSGTRDLLYLRDQGELHGWELQVGVWKDKEKWGWGWKSSHFWGTSTCALYLRRELRLVITLPGVYLPIMNVLFFSWFVYLTLIRSSWASDYHAKAADVKRAWEAGSLQSISDGFERSLQATPLVITYKPWELVRLVPGLHITSNVLFNPYNNTLRETEA